MKKFIYLLTWKKKVPLKQSFQEWFTSLKASFKKKSKEERIINIQNQLFHSHNKDINKPFMFVRIFIILLIIYAFAYLAFDITVSNLSISLLIPFTFLWFLYEQHKPSSLNGVDILKIFLFGGLASLFVTYFIRDYVGYPNIVFVQDLLTGAVEETAKLVVLVLALMLFKVKHVVTGMLVGFAIGAGFDVFESSAYGIDMFIDTFNFTSMHVTILYRSLFALIGAGHHFWTAILGGTLVYLINQTGKIEKALIHPIFLGWFLIVILLHTMWNFLNSFVLIVSLPIAFLSLAIFILMWLKSKDLYDESIVLIDGIAEEIVTQQEGETPAVEE